MQHVSPPSTVGVSTSDSLGSSTPEDNILDDFCHRGPETSNMSSRISLRHGIKVGLLKLLSANPPETKITNLSELDSCSSSSSSSSSRVEPKPRDPTRLPVNDSYPCNATNLHPRSSSTSTVSTSKFMIDNETGTQVQKHPDLWFEDGSVICRAENTLFCVHMSQLARHSLVFNDMFMLPQGPDGSTRMGPFMALTGPGGESEQTKTATTRKAPVVYLYDDAEDVANLFTALYDGPYVIHRYTCPLTYESLHSGRLEITAKMISASSPESYACQRNISLTLFVPRHLHI